jgi:N-acetylneuraminic acid mutarotase
VFGRINLSTFEQEPLCAMSVQRCVHALVPYENQMIAVGGHDGVGPVAGLDFYCSKKRKWDALPADLQHARPMCMAALVDTMLYVIGGVNEKSEKLSSMEKVDLRTNSMTFCSNMISPRASAGIATLRDPGGLPVMDAVGD